MATITRRDLENRARLHRPEVRYSDTVGVVRVDGQVRVQTVDPDALEAAMVAAARRQPGATVTVDVVTSGQVMAERDIARLAEAALLRRDAQWLRQQAREGKLGPGAMAEAARLSTRAADVAAPVRDADKDRADAHRGSVNGRPWLGPQAKATLGPAKALAPGDPARLAWLASLGKMTGHPADLNRRFTDTGVRYSPVFLSGESREAGCPDFYRADVDGCGALAHATAAISGWGRSAVPDTDSRALRGERTAEHRAEVAAGLASVGARLDSMGRREHGKGCARTGRRGGRGKGRGKGAQAK